MFADLKGRLKQTYYESFCCGSKGREKSQTILITSFLKSRHIFYNIDRRWTRRQPPSSPPSCPEVPSPTWSEPETGAGLYRIVLALKNALIADQPVSLTDRHYLFLFLSFSFSRYSSSFYISNFL